MSAFKNRLFLSYAAMTVGLVVLFAALLIGFTASSNRQTELSHQVEVFEGHLAQVEDFLFQANRLAMQVSGNHEILSLFMALDEPGNEAGGGENYFEEELLDAIRVSSLLSGVNGVDPFAERISVFNRYGDYVSAGRLYETRERIQYSLGEVYIMDAVMDEVSQRADHCLVLGFHEDTWSNNPNLSFITLFRNLCYTETSRPYGLVAVQMDAQRLTSLGVWQTDEGGGYFLIDDWHPEAPALLFQDEETIDVEAVYPLLTQAYGQAVAQGEAVGRLSYSLRGQDTLMLVARPAISNWLMVRALPQSALSRPYRQSYFFMVLGCLGLLALLLVVVNYVAERISRPLRTLSGAIQGIGLKNMRLPQPDQAYSICELAALDQAFRAMLGRLDQAIAVEVQGHMRALQAQMNPHFLYNMLSVIIASSESAGDEHTVSMCMKLTEMLRYIADAGRENVTIAEEIAHTRNYLDLMKERYEDLFDYHIQVDQAARAVPIPRLTLQPLAENSFMHGFRNAPPWTLHIAVSAGQGRWTLRVEDNGVGMSPQEIDAFDRRLKDYQGDVARNYEKLKLGGMGLINTLLRLTLMYNEPVRYAIRAGAHGGLTVEIGGAIYDSRTDCRG